MKNIVLLFLVLATSCGTDNEEGKFYRYTIQNESGKSITIKSYLSNLPNIEPLTFNIEIGEKLTKTYQDGLPPTPYDFGNFFGDIDNPRDSIKVIYNNSKVSYLIGEHSQNERNPLNGNIYNKTEETFTFTLQDYENAEDCNGNCD